MSAIVPRVPSTHGVPPDHEPAAVRLHDHRRAEDRGTASRCRRDRPRLRQPRHPVTRRSRSTSSPRRRTTPATTGTRRARASRSCARPSPRCTSATSASSSIPRPRSSTRSARRRASRHLMWVLLAPGDAAVVPSPSYPIHIYGPLFAGAEIREVPMGMASGDIESGDEFFESLDHAFRTGWPRPRVIVVSFPHNPTTACVDLAFMQRLVDFALEHEVIVVHDFAYADVGFDGYQPPSILQANGAKECAVELYSMTKSFSMAGWRIAFMVGNAEVVAALAKLKSYLDYGTFQPIQIAATVTMNEASDYPREVNAIYQSRRDAAVRRARPHRLGLPEAEGHDVRLGADPRAVPRDGLARVRVIPRTGSRGGDVSRHRVRRRRRRSSCGSRSSRTSSASTRPCATCARPSRSCNSSPSSASLPPAPARCARQSVLRAHGRRTAPPVSTPE